MGWRAEVLLKREETNSAKKTLYHLLMGIAAIGVLEGLILLFLCDNRQAAVCGLLLGLWIAVVNTVYIYRSLSKALELNEKSSVKAMRGSVLVRYLFMAAVVTISLRLPDVFSPLGVVLGLLSMKVSAYAQPLFMEKTRHPEVFSEYEESMDLPEEYEESSWGVGIFHNPDLSQDEKKQML